MSTSLSTREIVLGKWLGVYRTVPLLAILPTFVIGVLAYERDAGPWWAAAMCVYVLCAGAAVTSLGLALATRLSRRGAGGGRDGFALRRVHGGMVLPDARDVGARRGKGRRC